MKKNIEKIYDELFILEKIINVSNNTNICDNKVLNNSLLHIFNFNSDIPQKVTGIKPEFNELLSLLNINIDIVKEKDYYDFYKNNAIIKVCHKNDN